MTEQYCTCGNVPITRSLVLNSGNLCQECGLKYVPVQDGQNGENTYSDVAEEGSYVKSNEQQAGQEQNQPTEVGFEQTFDQL